MNFALILLVLTLFTGVLWVFDTFKWRKERKARADLFVRRFEDDNREAIDRGVKAVIDERNALYANEMREPWWLDYTAGLFPVFLFVFVLRSFLFEPFRIPSGSMLPTLHIGDFILVNKYDYGVRLPVIGTKVIPMGSPKRGDVVVFRYPMDPSVDYIKRVVGLPGDQIQYINKRLFVNGVEQPQKPTGDWVDPDTMVTLSSFDEKLGERVHKILKDDRLEESIRGLPYPRGTEYCKYTLEGFTCKVPEGNYFMLGDNRDNSEDSRYWGVVPDEYLVGRAFFIWLNVTEPSRIGSFK
ncbi:MAG: signal peptidase I [Duodenibacillus sp.]|nr:signal peptidase I [Duodenibacillus sp.]HBC68896.1 signal peptidase I [Sutterella sp.]